MDNLNLIPCNRKTSSPANSTGAIQFEPERSAVVIPRLELHPFRISNCCINLALSRDRLGRDRLGRDDPGTTFVTKLWYRDTLTVPAKARQYDY